MPRLIHSLILLLTVCSSNVSAAGRTLVLIVHGTYNGDSSGNWARVFDGQATFASELIRGLGRNNVDVYSDSRNTVCCPNR